MATSDPRFGKSTRDRRGNGPAGGGVLFAVRAQFREAAGDALAGVLQQLEQRVRGPEALATRAERRDQLGRVREVLERDRALTSAALPEEPAHVPSLQTGGPTASTPEPVAIACDEPIRTRSMAKLLAAQGYPDRALSIYAYLLGRHPEDPTLHAEADALRAAQRDSE